MVAPRQIAAADVAGFAGTLPFTATGGTIARTLADRATDVVRAKDFGVKADGTSDDTTALRAALATGRSVALPDGTIVLSGGLTLQTNGQRLYGQGQGKTLLKPSGNFDVITLTGGKQGMAVTDLQIEGAAMTGGNAINVTNADRVELRSLIVTNPWNFLYVKKSNVTAAYECWVNNTRGAYGVQWYGDAANRSDVLRLVGVTISGNSTARPTLILWDGNAQTLELEAVNLVLPGIGLWVKNTAGAGNPGFLLSKGLQVDFPSEQALLIEVGNSFWLQNVYLQGSINNYGAEIRSGVRNVQFNLGKITGNYLAGVLNNGADVSLSDLWVGDNSLVGYGQYSGIIAGPTSNGLRVRAKSGAIAGGAVTQKFGVEAQAGSVNTIVAGGDLSLNVLGEWVDNSGGGNSNFQVFGNAGSFVSQTSNVVFTTLAGFGGQIALTVSGGAITGASVVSAGRGYYLSPNIVLSGGGGTGGSVSVTISGGQITGATVNAGGSGYTSAPNAFINAQSIGPAVRTYSAGAASADGNLRAQGGGGWFIGNDNGTFASIYDSSARFGRSVPVNGTFGGTHFASTTSFSVAGDAQTSLHVMRASGSGAVTLRLTSTGSGNGSGGTSIPLADNSAIELSATLVARNTTTGDSAVFYLENALLTRGAGVGTTTLVGGTWTAGPASAGATGLTPSISADTTNGGPNLSLATTSGNWRAVARAFATHVQ